MTTSCSEATVNRTLMHKHEEFYGRVFKKKKIVQIPTEGNPQRQKIKLIEVPNIFLLF